MVKLHREGSAPSAYAADLFIKINKNMFILFLIILWSGKDIEKNQDLRATFFLLKNENCIKLKIFPLISETAIKKLKQKIEDSLARIFVQVGTC